MIADSSAENRPAYDFANPVVPQYNEFEDRFILELVETPAFQRLKSIRFLGGIDYLFVRSPNGKIGNIRYTRYQHSLGVALLAQFYCQFRGLNQVDRKLVMAAALLHDLGHAPLSHSLEPVFREAFGLEHHLVTERIVLGLEVLGREVCETLRKYRVDIDQLVAVIAGKDDRFNGFFAGPINFDTIEGILRTLSLAWPNGLFANPLAVVKAALSRDSEADRRLVDEFWKHKDIVYRMVINSRDAVFADFVCQFFMRENLGSIKSNDYFLTEERMFEKLPGLRQVLTSPSFRTEIAKYFSAPISFKARRFSVAEHEDFFERKDKLRYRQEKYDEVLTASGSTSQQAMGRMQDLFI